MPCGDDLQEEEAAIGDVDLFSLSEENSEIPVNAHWLQHLQERLLGEAGHPRKVWRCRVARQEGGSIIVSTFGGVQGLGFGRCTRPCRIFGEA